MKDEKIIVCILNKNDGKNLKTLETKIQKVNQYYTTYLIDGNSTDDSIKIAQNFGINISNFGSLSRGESIKECINKFKKDFEYIIFTSSDGEENLDDISYFKSIFQKVLI